MNVGRKRSYHLVLVPLHVCAVAGLRVRAGNSYRQTPAVAGLCTLAIDVLILVVGLQRRHSLNVAGLAVTQDMEWE